MAQRHKDSMAQWHNGKVDRFILKEIIFAGNSNGFSPIACEPLCPRTFLL